MILGRTICWLLRRHHWRRLHKGERLEFAPNSSDHKQARTCSRCGAMRFAKRRAAKQ